jgi:hypothetical protein
MNRPTASAARGGSLVCRLARNDDSGYRRQLLMLEQKQAVAALNQQIAARKNQLTETEFSLHELPTVMAQKV